MLIVTQADVLAGDGGETPAVFVCDDGPFRHERLWRGAAIAFPVFAVRTKDSVGAGEFMDLKKVVDFCCATGPPCLPLLLSCHALLTYSP